MKTKLLFCLLIVCSIFNGVIAQNSPLKLIVKWKKESYEHKVELYNTANDLLLTLCDDHSVIKPRNQVLLISIV